MVEIVVYEKIGSTYIEKVVYEDIKEHLAEALVKKDYYLFEDDKVKVEVSENKFSCGSFGEDDGQIMFMFPTVGIKGKETEGITFNKMFEIGLDYESIVEKIKDYIEGKCKNKFTEYIDEKKIILLELKFKFGMDIMVDLNNMSNDLGFSFEKLNYIFRDKYYESLKGYADEVWIMHRGEERDQMIQII